MGLYLGVVGTGLAISIVRIAIAKKGKKGKKTKKLKYFNYS